MIIVCQTLLKKTKILGISLFPFILLRNRDLKFDKILINHERIHLRQQLELGILLFYLLYISEFLYYWFRYRNRYIAYRKISFEREAYKHQGNLNYLKTRKLWANFKLIMKN